MILSGENDAAAAMKAVKLGVHDYLTKPFSVREFQARVKAIFRRMDLYKEEVVQTQENPLLDFGDLLIDVDKRKVTVRGERIDLSPKEFDLLTLLASHPGKSYNRQSILNRVWGYDFDGFQHTVNSHINRLRRKIEPDMENPTYILTTWGVGYRFNEEL